MRFVLVTGLFVTTSVFKELCVNRDIYEVTTKQDLSMSCLGY